MFRRYTVTANDFVFWYEEVYLNEDLLPVPNPDFMANGKSGSSARLTTPR